MNSFSGIWRRLAAPIAVALVLATPVAAHAAPPASAPTALSARAPLAPVAEAPASLPALAPPQGPLSPSGCTVTGTAAATCELWALTGTVVLPGAAAPVPIWGFASTSAGPATGPGPVLVVDQGTAVTVNLHNGLTRALSLAVPALTGLAPDTGGAAPGATKSYTFTASRPGTYLYEAGHTVDGARQVAMGLVGALVVRGAGFDGRPSAYGDAASAYDDEALVVLTEIDPAFNANPLGYDLRAFTPKYRLINGKAFPETDVIATDISRTVLLRYLDAGLLAHPMTLLGVDQAVVGQDSRPSAYPEGAVTIPLRPGQAVDAVVHVPAGPDGRKFALMESGGQLNNAGQRYGAAVAGVSPQQAFGGMLTFLDTNPPADSLDHIGPTASSVAASPNPTSVLNAVTVTASFSDALNGNSVVDDAELVVDDLSVAEGTSAIRFTSPAFGTGPTVTGATATIPTSVLGTLTQGLHTIFVRAHDVAGNWGVVGSTMLNLSTTGAATTAVVLTPNPTPGSGAVGLTATGDDTGLGGQVTAAEYFVDATGANGAGTALTLAVMGATSTSEVGTVPAVVVAALAEGRHTVLVHTLDSFGLWGPFASADLVVDRTVPTLLSAAVLPSTTNGTNGSPSDPADLRINAAFADPMSNAVNSRIAAAEGFLDSPGADGTGVTFVALDGTFNTATENTYGLVPLTELTGLANGTHQILVHSRDGAGNWGPLAAVTFTLDRQGPTVSAVAASPNPVAFTGTLTLTATAVDNISAVTGAEWYDGTDPGAGHGIAMTVSGSALSASIAPGTLTAGSHTLRVRAKDALGNWGAPGSVTVTVQAAPNAIFADAFASNTPAAWSQTVGTPSAATGALVATGVAYVVDNTPAAERGYHAKFDFTVGSFNAGTATVDVFQARNAAGAAVATVQARRNGTTTQFRLGLFRSGAWGYSAWVTATTAAVTIRVDWSSAVAGSGSLKVGSAATVTQTGNTSASVVESAALGLIVRSNNTPTGSASFDNFSSTRYTAP